MNEKFNKLTEGFYASPQITVAEVAGIAADGFDLIINNRPDGEEAGQPAAADIEAAARQAGIAYVYIPIGRDGVSAADLDRFDEASESRKKVLGFCRTGTRSTVVRSLACARSGMPVDTVLAEAANGGYDLSGQREVLSGFRTHNNT